MSIEDGRGSEAEPAWWTELAEELYARTERVISLLNKADNGEIPRGVANDEIRREINLQRSLVLKYAGVPREWYQRYLDRRTREEFSPEGLE